MGGSFLLKLFYLEFSSKLLIKIYVCHLLIYFFLGLGYDMQYNYDEVYNAFLVFSNEFPKKITTKEVVFNQISKDEFINLHTEFINDTTINDLIQNNYVITVIHDLFSNLKQFKSQLKEFNVHYTDIKYINYINDNIVNKLKVNTVCNLFSGFGKFIYDTYSNDKKYVLIDENEHVILISYLNVLIKHKDIKNVTHKINNIITDDIINSNFDLVLADVPDDIRNLIYTNCNTKIKFLKIRGTKSEPLILQYISQILSKNGVGIIITPNSLLFGDSIQHINTRKYIIENCGVEVINLDNKKSILIINKIKSDKVTFKFFDSNDIYDFQLKDIIKNNYSFYYYNYNKELNDTNTNNNLKINDIINIVEFNKNNNINYNVLYSYKNNLFNIDKIENIHSADYMFLTKNEDLYNQDYLNNELLFLFENKLKNLQKGKTNQLNIDAIKELHVTLPSVETQKLLVNINNNNKDTVEKFNSQIQLLELLKKSYFKNEFCDAKYIKLSDICTINHESTDKNTIYIYRNTINAGYVNLTSTQNETTTNNYYLHLIDNNILHDYLYFVLLYFENEFVNVSNINKTVSLSKKFLENFEIPNLDINKQKKIITKITEINTHITNLLNLQNNINKPLNYIIN